MVTFELRERNWVQSDEGPYEWDDWPDKYYKEIEEKFDGQLKWNYRCKYCKEDLGWTSEDEIMRNREFGLVLECNTPFSCKILAGLLVGESMEID